MNGSSPQTGYTAGMRASFVVVLAIGCASPPKPDADPPRLALPSAAPSAPAPPPTTAAKVENKDADGDGIVDKDDKCPFEPETYNGIDDEDGCPEPAKVVVVSSNPPPVERVSFEKGSIKLTASAKPIVDAVAQVMKQHAEIELVQIEGHAEPTEPKPLDLAQKRADAIRATLIQQGIDGARLRARGFGAFCGKADNRRVEFKVVTISGKPATTPLGCDDATKAGIPPSP